MPEIIFEDLPQLLQENKEIRSEVHMAANRYIQNYHPKGWNRIDGVKKYIEQHHYLIEAPIQDFTFGGFIRTTNTKKSICYINSAQPRIYQNFVLFHELYHLITINEVLGKLHLIEVDIDNRSSERKADYFSSLLLLDEHELRAFFTGPENKEETLFHKVLLCMNAFKAPYKAVLIRLYELNLIEIEDLEVLFHKKINFIEEFQNLGKDTYIFEASNNTNFKSLEILMKNNPLPAVAQHSNENVLEDIRSFFLTHGKENRN
ncbi:ImmA/IrrE family metallo-endopeptidase [Bacillus tianshenii]|nr:ImmA/IrrE family metallo-endopeptidase [Bacillus tianshenii]